MSNAAQTWAWSLPMLLPNGGVLTKRAKDVLGRLADYADANFECFPGQVRLANELFVDRRTIMRALADLESVGLLSRRIEYRGSQSRGGRAKTIYKLLPGSQTVTIVVLTEDAGDLEVEVGDVTPSFEKAGYKGEKGLGVKLSPNLLGGEKQPVDNSRLGGGYVTLSAGLGDSVTIPIYKALTTNEPSSSVLQTELRAEIENDDVAASPPDDDLGIEMFSGVVESEMDRLLSAVDAKLSFVELKRLIPEPLLSTLNIHRACTEILGRSKVVVKNPNAFVAKAIKDAPTEFFTGGEQSPPSQEFGATKPSWVCSRNGHKLDSSSEVKTCLFCDLVVKPDGWKCEEHGHFRYMTSDVSCRECGHDMTNNSIHIHTAAQF